MCRHLSDYYVVACECVTSIFECLRKPIPYARISETFFDLENISSLEKVHLRSISEIHLARDRKLYKHYVVCLILLMSSVEHSNFVRRSAI